MSETFEVGAPVWEDPDTVRVPVRVPPGSVFFQGHFEGRPMLPGVAQVVSLASAQARVLFAPLGAPRRLVRVKFQAVVKPGDGLLLELTREAASPETKIRFVLSRNDDTPEPCSSGVLVYR